MILRKAYTVTGIANREVLDSSGLQSTDESKKRCLGVEIIASVWNVSKIQIWLDQEKIQEFYGEQCPTYESVGDTNIQKDVGRTMFFEVELDLSSGQVLKIGTYSGSTLMSIIGCYVYEKL